MKHSELRQKFLDFFAKNGHLVLPSAPLVPQGDDTTLFTTAGMQSLSPFLNGSATPEHTRLTNSQMCLRTNDLDIIGDDTHLTFFEMLGSWSIGDYSKEDAIKFAHDFLTSEDGLNIPKSQLWVTVFEGDESQNVPRDEEAAKIWESHNMPKERIAFLPAEDNWWASGPVGLCGPDTEIFFDTKFPEPVPEGQNPGNDPDGRFVEIWNSVFMSYDRKPDGSLATLPAQNVDQGAGLERMLAVLNGTTIYQTDCFSDCITLLKDTQTKETDHDRVSRRIIADHMRSTLFILSEVPQIYPGNNKQGYILRHLIRQAVEHAHDLGLSDDVLMKCLDINANLYKDHYPQVGKNLEEKKTIFKHEQERFEKILKRAPSIIEKFTDAASPVIPGEVAHNLGATHGIPVSVVQRYARRNGKVVDMDAYKDAVEAHKTTSRGISSDPKSALG